MASARILIPPLMQSIGLDASRYRSTGGESDERYFGTLDSMMSDAERYKDVDPFVVRCRSCQGQVAFEPISDRDVRMTSTSLPGASTDIYDSRRFCSRRGRHALRAKARWGPPACSCSSRHRSASTSGGITRAGLCATTRRAGTGHA